MNNVEVIKRESVITTRETYLSLGYTAVYGLAPVGTARITSNIYLDAEDARARCPQATCIIPVYYDPADIKEEKKA